MGSYSGRIDRDLPVDLAHRVSGRLNMLQQPLPGPVRRPQPVTLVHGLPRAVPLRQITPLHPSPHAVENPVDHLPMVTPPSAPPVADRQKRTQPCPLGIREITPPHAQDNDQIPSESHDRPDSL